MCRALGGAGQAEAPAAPATSRIPAETTCLGTARRFPTDRVLSPASHNCHLSLPSHNCQSALFPPPSSHVPGDSLGKMLMSREVISTPLLPLHTHRLHALERAPRPRCSLHTSHFLPNTGCTLCLSSLRRAVCKCSPRDAAGGKQHLPPLPGQQRGCRGQQMLQGWDPSSLAGQEGRWATLSQSGATRRVLNQP